MYSQVNKFASQIILHLQTGTQFTQEYPYLCKKLHEINIYQDTKYQSLYRKFWSMNQARLNESFFSKYFEYLETNKNVKDIDSQIFDILEFLYNIPQGKKEINKYQFSFVSKLCHMINTDLPIYDKFIKSFYFLSNINSSKPIDSFMEQFIFLKNEYSRIINSNLLSTAIKQFNNSQMATLNYSKTKIIDSLIWGFIDLLYKDKIKRIEIFK